MRPSSVAKRTSNISRYTFVVCSRKGEIYVSIDPCRDLIKLEIMGKPNVVQSSFSLGRMSPCGPEWDESNVCGSQTS